MIIERKRELSTKYNEDKARMSALREASTITDDEGAKAALIEREEAWAHHLSSLDRETADRFEREMRKADAIVDTRLNGLRALIRRHEEARQTDAKRQERNQALADLELECEQLDREIVVHASRKTAMTEFFGVDELADVRQVLERCRKRDELTGHQGTQAEV